MRNRNKLQRASKKIFSVVLSLMLSAQVVNFVDGNVVYAAEAGEPRAVIKINDEAGLRAIADDTEGSYKLTADIKLGDAEWVSIKRFSGTLDGAGYTISNLHSSSAQGLFEIIDSSATVKNLTVEGNLTGTEMDFGLFAGHNAGHIINCVSKGRVWHDKEGDGVSFAGMVSANAGTMVDCVNEAEVYRGTAGLTANNSGAMINCVNKGKVTNDNMYGGGVAGINNYMLYGCENQGEVIGKDMEGRRNHSVGGVAGFNTGLISQCINRGLVSVPEDSYYALGGVAGELYAYAVISGCANYGKVNGTLKCDMGGIVGSASNRAGSFDENGNFSATKGSQLIADCANYGEIGGGSMIAGIVGTMYTYSSPIRVIGCSNYGKINGWGFAGGIACSLWIALNEQETDDAILFLEDNHNFGEITGGTISGVVAMCQDDRGGKCVVRYCTNEADLNGGSVFGISSRLSGLIYGCANKGNLTGTLSAMGIAAVGAENTWIENCYNTGNLKAEDVWGIAGTSELKNCYSAGEVVAENNYYVNCYSETNENMLVEGQGIALSSEQMSKKESYQGFDFENIWEMKEQNGRMLPALREALMKPETAELSKKSWEIREGEEFQVTATRGIIRNAYMEDMAVLEMSEAEVFKGKYEGTTTLHVVFTDGQIKTAQVKVTDPVKAFVSRMYTVALGRDAEEKGLNEWTEKLKNHTIDGAGIAQGFIESDEFNNKMLSDEEYVETLYRTFFNREKDEGGFATWLNALAGGSSNRYVLAGFVNSTEFQNLCDQYGIDRGELSSEGGAAPETETGVRGFVLRCYTKVLERQGEENGVNDWAGRISGGRMTAEDVAKSFYFSQEYINKNTTDEHFVESLYQTFMNRNSDEGGKAYWLQKLSSGEKDRNGILEGFSKSPEFAAILETYGL